MEWLLPVLFVAVSLLQWWLKHRQTIKDSSQTNPRPTPEHRETADPFGEMDDLLEALGRGRHETPPVIPSVPVARRKEPPAILPQAPTRTLPLQPQSIPQHPIATPSSSPPPNSGWEPIKSRHSWRKKLGEPYTTKEAVVLSEILALPVALR
ncbi:MAG: hypothetical protein EBZ78_00835 [Verrucomicrobia bacterium]|nr:hypothetical protein [Verrucomicrobiota bacterium]